MRRFGRATIRTKQISDVGLWLEAFAIVRSPRRINGACALLLHQWLRRDPHRRAWQRFGRLPPAVCDAPRALNRGCRLRKALKDAVRDALRCACMRRMDGAAAVRAARHVRGAQHWRPRHATLAANAVGHAAQRARRRVCRRRGIGLHGRRARRVEWLCWLEVACAGRRVAQTRHVTDGTASIAALTCGHSPAVAGVGARCGKVAGRCAILRRGYDRVGVRHGGPGRTRHRRPGLVVGLA
mmetsp:Transcript_7214/g.21954  ORF Transcript_7214/g.21954 Transcript_7214/m.21954 type:complete len:240 (-) Transcript_7214:4929-5648(-)